MLQVYVLPLHAHPHNNNQAGMLPLEPTSVVPAGREVGFHAVANSLVLVDGFAWRLLPMVRDVNSSPSHNPLTQTTQSCIYIYL